MSTLTIADNLICMVTNNESNGVKRSQDFPEDTTTFPPKTVIYAQCNNKL